MKILVINAGSSSLKYQLFDMDKEEVLAKGLCERIGIPGGKLKHTGTRGECEMDVEMDNHSAAIGVLIDAIVDPKHGSIDSLTEITAVGHRVVHGGEAFKRSALIDDEAMKAIEACCDLAPLHNPPNIVGIKACQQLMEGVPQIAVFDTAFHQTMPKTSFIYPLPYEYYKQYRIRRYGFHGSSHRYVTQRAAAMLGKKVDDINIITCHLGNGSSITAVKNGTSYDTTMGFTPLEGLMMGTRCGNIDPAIIQFVMDKEGISIKDFTDVMNKKSGVLGISGVSSDFRDVEQAADGGNERARLALDVFIYQVKKFIGSYAAAMGGVDAIVFTAGIGENNCPMREKIVSDMEFMGVKIDFEKNKIRGREIDISTDDAKVRVLVIPTNEELMIAISTRNVLLR